MENEMDAGLGAVRRGRIPSLQARKIYPYHFGIFLLPVCYHGLGVVNREDSLPHGKKYLTFSEFSIRRSPKGNLEYFGEANFKGFLPFKN